MRPFVMGNPKALVHLGGDADDHGGGDREPGRLPFTVADARARPQRGRAVGGGHRRPAGDGRQRGRPRPGSTSSREYDQYSLYEFLRFKGWSRGAIEYYAVMNFVEADMHNALVEVLREDLGGAYVDMQEIAGGMDGLPNAFYAELQDEVRLGAEVFAIDQDPDGVTVHYKTEVGPVQRARRLRHRDPAVPGAADGRGHSSRSRRPSSGRSASSTTTPRPRSCSRSATASGRTDDGILRRRRPSPTCRSGG